MFFSRKKEYNRKECLKAARAYEAKGRKNKAINGYLKILENEPADYEVHGRVAPLLAKKKRYAESWDSFLAASQGFREAGFVDKAVGYLVKATRVMPWKTQAWDAAAALYVDLDRRPDAVRTLFEGHKNFRKKAERDEAVRLLRKASNLEPWNFEVTFELAKILKKKGEKAESIGLLEGLSDRTGGRELKRVRAALFLMSPGFSNAWRWLRPQSSVKAMDTT